MSARLPVLATVSAAYRDVFGDFRGTLRAMALIGALLVLLVELPMLFLSDYVDKTLIPEMQHAAQSAGAAASSAPAAAATAEEAIPTATKILVMVAALLIYTVQMILVFRFTNAWYRQLLLSENKGKIIGFRLGKGEWQLMWTSVKVGFVLLPFVIFALGIISSAYPTGDYTAPPNYNPWPYLAALGLIVLYVQARLATAYPATAIGEDEAPARQSWSLTRHQGVWIAIGNLLIELPIIITATAFFMVLSWVLNQLITLPEGGVSTPLMDGGFFVLRCILKALGVVCTLVFIAALSAFHARTYAYLVRSSAPATLH